MPTYTNNTGTTQIVRNLAGNNQVVGDGESIQTYQILAAEGWTKTSDEPYLKLANFREEVTAPGSVTGLLGSTLITLAASVDGITVTANAAGNPNGYQLAAGVVVEIDNPGEIDALYFSGGPGIVLVQGQP